MNTIMKKDFISMMGLSQVAELEEMEAALKAKRLRAIHTILNTELTPLQREAVEKVILQGMTIKEIAAERNVNQSTISRNFHRGYNKLCRFAQYLL